MVVGLVFTFKLL